METTYHHGNLPRVLLGHAADMAAEGNPESITLRGLARRADVTHSAPVHHFGTRKRLLTALATEGFTDLAGALGPHAGDIKAMGNAYVAWALNHPGHYAVMWQPRLLDEAYPTLIAARERLWALLSEAAVAASSGDDPTMHEADAQAAFALVHGLASIWLNGTLPVPENATARIALITERLTTRDP